MEGIGGITLPNSIWNLVNQVEDDYLFFPGGFEFPDYQTEVNMEQVTTLGITKTVTNYKIGSNENSLVTTSPIALKCSASFSIVIAILAVSGALASLMGILDSVVNHKVDRHFFNFLHIYFANTLVFVALPCTLTARFQGHWKYSKGTYEALSVIVSSAQTACSLQLTFLVVIRSKEVEKGGVNERNRWNKAICCFLWIAAFATSWPSAFYADVFGDVIMGEQVSRSFGGKLYIKAEAIIGFIFPALMMVGSLIVAIASFKRKRSANETPSNAIEGVKEAAVLFALFILCWLPYKAYRLMTLEHENIPGCGATLDIFICITTAFSIFSPIVHFVFAKRRDPGVRIRQETCTVSGLWLTSRKVFAIKRDWA